MSRRHLLLALLTYVVLDLSNPFVPGAFAFDPDECVEGITRWASSSVVQRADACALGARLRTLRLELPASSPLRLPAGGRHPVLEWLVDAREDARSTRELPPPGEEH
jgi:hypothetical protein